jgi:hypothetical protein
MSRLNQNIAVVARSAANAARSIGGMQNGVVIPFVSGGRISTGAGVSSNGGYKTGNYSYSSGKNNAAASAISGL